MKNFSPDFVVRQKKRKFAETVLTLKQADMENCNTGASEPMAHYGVKGSSAYSTSGEIPSKALRDQRRQWYAHLEELAALKDDWNEEGAYAIVPELIELVRDFVPLASEKVLSHWWALPVPNGSLEMVPESDAFASISIGTNGISYLVKAEGRNKSTGVANGSPQNLHDIMECLTRVYSI
ncbi:MAG: hypothetical protein LIP03_04725 [Bacteroidales bacterium]|nr:hypothetical protein [Bacteroidales bacterium]